MYNKVTNFLNVQVQLNIAKTNNYFIQAKQKMNKLVKLKLINCGLKIQEKKNFDKNI